MPVSSPPSAALSNHSATSSTRTELLSIGLLTALCLLLPTHNSTLDAWYYAACVRHGHDLLLPHHLLYNAVGWLWRQVLPAAIDTLAALKALNALAFGGCLLVLRSLLRRVGGPAAPVGGWLLVAGSSFAMLRFATENETYLLPLLLSLLASRSAWRAAASETGLNGWLAAGSWATGACLLHQIHAFWWLGLLFGIILMPKPARERAAMLWRFVLPAVAIPLAYTAALPSWHLPFTLSAFWHFVFHDLYAGHAGAAPSGLTLLLTGINLVRTFGQVHGSTLALLRQWPALGGVLLLLSGWLAVAACWQLWGARRSQPRHLAGSPAPAPLLLPAPAHAFGVWFQRTHVSILILQLACAIWAAGNAEFMVMIPALLALLLVRRPWAARPLYLLGAALLLWNLSFGLLPSHLLRLTNTAPILARMEREPAAWWLLTDPNLVLNQLHYRTGNPVGPPTILAAPAQLARRPEWSAARFKTWLAGRRAAGQRVYTDALGGSQLLDRARLTQDGEDAQRALLAGYQLVRVDSLTTSFGRVYVTEIR